MIIHWGVSAIYKSLEVSDPLLAGNAESNRLGREGLYQAMAWSFVANAGVIGFSGAFRAGRGRNARIVMVLTNTAGGEILGKKMSRRCQKKMLQT